MKKIITLAVILTLHSSFFTLHSYAQLWGMTGLGGANDLGVIYSINLDGSNYQVRHSFDSINGSRPNGGLIKASDGKLYGLTPFGGVNNMGIIFSFDTTTNTFTKLYDFNLTDGGYPLGSLVEAANGNLYGMTNQGGSGTYGVVFRFVLANNTYFHVYDFSGGDGGYPYNSLTKAPNGMLYGMTFYGGLGYPNGTAFKVNPQNNAFTNIVCFGANMSGSSVDGPFGNLLMANNNKLYGLCFVGNGIFDIDSAGIVTNFGEMGSNYGSLIQASDGQLYGIDRDVIFGFNTTTSNYIGYATTYPASPIGELIEAGYRKLYGITRSGGMYNKGTIFYYNLDNNNITYIHNFDSTTGYFYYENNFPGEYEPMVPWGDLLDMSNDVGINNLSKSNQLEVTISPNPFSDFTTLTIKSDVNINSYSIVIYDITGREVQRIAGISGTTNHYTINRNKLEPGMYFYKLMSGDNEIIVSGKLIVN